MTVDAERSNTFDLAGRFLPEAGAVSNFYNGSRLDYGDNRVERLVYYIPVSDTLHVDCSAFRSFASSVLSPAKIENVYNIESGY